LGCLGFIATVCSTAAVAATYGAEVSDETLSGQPISQTFLSDDASFVRTPDGDACVASATIDIDGSSYVDVNGAAVAFSEVIRSRAASLQYVRPADGSVAFFRIQYKYFPLPDQPMPLAAGGRVFDLARFLEPSTDSVRIDDPAIVETLRAALETGAGIRFEGVSRDTGRRVIDRIDAMGFMAVDLCAENPRLVAERSAEPNDLVSLVVDVTPTPAHRAEIEAARACGMTDPAGPVYRGRVRETTGFFAQTRTVYAVFTPEGAISHLYVPGILEVRDASGGVYAGDISLASNGNVPTAPNTVRGCLGMGPITVLGYAIEDGAHRFGAAPGRLIAGLYEVGDLLAADLFDPFDALGDLIQPIAELGDAGRSAGAPATIAFGPRGDRSRTTPFASGGGSPGSILGGGGFSSAGQPSSDPFSLSDDPKSPSIVAAIPLPPALLMMLAGLGLLRWVSRSRSRAV
jgi:hypothetical protein